MDNVTQDAWQAGDPYEFYMGRWSRLVAEKFIDWLSPGLGLQWLDVGCGTGALAAAISSKCQAQALVAIDQSEGFVRTAQQRLGDKASCKIGNAMALSISDATIDAAVSGLVLNFLPDPEKAISEMQRVTRNDGSVAVYIWDYAGKMEFLNYFWDAAVESNSSASALHESYRFPNANAEYLVHIFNQVGLSAVETTALDIITHFVDFDDYWKPFLGGQGPAPTYVSKLNESEINQLKESIINRLPFNSDGSISLTARAWACQGKVVR